MQHALAPGSTNTYVGDIIGSCGLFISPPWEAIQNIIVPVPLVDYVLDALTAGQRLLLLGEAGQGKTTILKQLFTLIADQFMKQDDQPIPFPLYIPLREISSFSGNPLEIIWACIQDEFPLSFEGFSFLMKQHLVILLLDGFDEVNEEFTQYRLNERAASKIFTYPSLLSCRKSFFDAYLTMSPLHEYYHQWIELQPLTLTSEVTTYIEAFCQQKRSKSKQQSITASENIIKLLGTSRELQDLVQRPLLLIMMLDIFTDPKTMSEPGWTVVKLYQKYTEKWLKNESGKPGSVLLWHEKMHLLQELAILPYMNRSSQTFSWESRNQQITFPLSDLHAFIKRMIIQYPHFTEAVLLNDLCFHTLLSVTGGDHYAFLHKSFQEYCVARYIVGYIRSKEQESDVISAVEMVFQEFLPWDVGSFLKGILTSSEIPSTEKEEIVTVLIKVYQRNRKNDSRSITLRQHTSHYMALLATKQARQFLEQACYEEQDKWVQRGMMVGLALYCDRMDILEQYMRTLRADPDAASLNLGYYLVYYGDQPHEMGYYDQGGENCHGTLQAIFRRLQDEHFRRGWILDLLTLSTLLEQRGIKILLPYQRQRSFLEQFFKENHQDLGLLFQQEKKHLQAVLQGANV
jgi:hypothetical protein